MTAPYDGPALRSRHELGANRIPIVRGPGSGHERVEFHERLVTLGQRRMQGPQRPSDFPQDPLNLSGFFALEAPQFVGELDRHGRLDEERRARIRLVVNDTADFSPAFSAYRNDVSTVSNRHRAVRHDEALG